MAGGAAQAEAPRRARDLGGLVRLLPRALPARRHPVGFLFELVSASGDRRAARRRRPRLQERGDRRAGVGAGDLVRGAAQEEPRRLRWRRAAPPADRRLLRGAAAEVRGHRGAAVLLRQLGRHGPASARQFRGLSARRLQAEMAGGARRHPLHAVLRQIRPGSAEEVFRPFPERRKQRLGQAAEGAAQRPPSRREVRAARRERMAAGAHAMDQGLPALRPRARSRAAGRSGDDHLRHPERRGELFHRAADRGDRDHRPGRGQAVRLVGHHRRRPVPGAARVRPAGQGSGVRRLERPARAGGPRLAARLAPQDRSGKERALAAVAHPRRNLAAEARRAGRARR